MTARGTGWSCHASSAARALTSASLTTASPLSSRADIAIAAAALGAKGGGAGLTLGAEQTAWLADAGVAYTDDQFKYVAPSAAGEAIEPKLAVQTS